MNSRKKKREQNLNKIKKKNYDSFENDPSDAVCPYCGKYKRSCSYVNSLSRAWARDICKKINTVL